MSRSTITHDLGPTFWPLTSRSAGRKSSQGASAGCAAAIVIAPATHAANDVHRTILRRASVMAGPPRKVCAGCRHSIFIGPTNVKRIRGASPAREGHEHRHAAGIGVVGVGAQLLPQESFF